MNHELGLFNFLWFIFGCLNCYYVVLFWLNNNWVSIVDSKVKYTAFTRTNEALEHRHLRPELNEDGLKSLLNARCSRNSNKAVPIECESSFCYCIFPHMFSVTYCLAIIWGSFSQGHHVVNRCGEDREGLTWTHGHQDKEQRRSDYNTWRERDAILCSGSHHSATSITIWNCSMLLSRKELYDILFSLTYLKSFSSSVPLYGYIPLNCMKCI